MFTPYYNTKDNISQYRQDLKVANKHCLNCNRPLKIAYLYCVRCNNELFQNGLEGHRVKIGSVGKNVINYQQYLHRSIFNCNVHFDYRGKKEERIKAKVSKRAIEVATQKLHRAFSCNKYRYDGKEYKNNEHNRAIYLAVSDTRNILKRIVYNTLLYYISYHIEDNHEFKTFVHFQTSMLHNALINIENVYIRKNRDISTLRFDQKRRYNNSNKYWYWLFQEVDKAIKPLMEEVIDSISK